MDSKVAAIRAALTGEDLAWVTGLRGQDALAAVGDSLESSRCWCDDCDGKTEHDGTCALHVGSSYSDPSDPDSLTDEQIQAVLDIARHYGKHVLVITGHTGHRGCGANDPGEILVSDARVVAVIE